jgi:hypothetical protein
MTYLRLVVSSSCRHLLESPLPFPLLSPSPFCFLFLVYSYHSYGDIVAQELHHGGEGGDILSRTHDYGWKLEHRLMDINWQSLVVSSLVLVNPVYNNNSSIAPEQPVISFPPPSVRQVILKITKLTTKRVGFVDLIPSNYYGLR